jgi:hypothetical protein
MNWSKAAFVMKFTPSQPTPSTVQIIRGKRIFSAISLARLKLNLATPRAQAIRRLKHIRE